jgi:putative transposase
MRLPRIKGEGRCTYQCWSSAVEGRLIFGHGGLGAKKFRSILYGLAAFMGIRILRCTLMGDHFHILFQVDKPKRLSLKTMLRRIGAYYGKAHLQKLLKKIKRVTDPAQRKALLERLLAPYRKRMNDLSIFMKEGKGGFAQWYNKVYKRYGALWAERFKSVLLETGYAVATVAAYIDLNPVRAGLCTDPKDYPYCGYAEALARGSPEDQENLRIILDLPERTSWEELCREYRKHLFMRGALASKNQPAAFGPEQVEKVVEQENGDLTAAELLRCRIRYFSDGVILGSRDFVQSYFERLKETLGYKRKSGPAPVKILPRAGLWVFRNVRTREFD